MNTNQLIESSVNIVIDESFCSRGAILSLVRSSSAKMQVFGFADVHQFIDWRQQNACNIHTVTIHIHDLMHTMHEQIVQFLVNDINKLSINSHKIIIVSDAVAKLKPLFMNELNIFNFVDGRTEIDMIASQLKEYIEPSATITNKATVKRNAIYFSHGLRYRVKNLSPAELIAVANVYVGCSVKESSKNYSGNYKTLYNQRMSAIRKLGMHTVLDLIKYRHLISAIYPISNGVTYNHFTDAYC
ncbi:hypothetical protein [Atlantibacter sp.]|uniref:hypothetical protein n=1 Tax=Atlantibacter sp. TaxID=1903473 RepID=UPI0028A99C03|nr:hypothetical protein [Atlantibacter sp.]